MPSNAASALASPPLQANPDLKVREDELRVRRSRCALPQVVRKAEGLDHGQGGGDVEEVRAVVERLGDYLPAPAAEDGVHAAE